MIARRRSRREVAPGRVMCCIPHCAATRRAEAGIGEWICPRHWKMANRTARRVLDYRKQAEYDSPEEKEFRVRQVWNAIKAEVVERLAGLR